MEVKTMINAQKLDRILLDLGFSDILFGTDYLREAVRLYDGGRTQITGEIYPEIAAKYCTRKMAVERCIRHAISRAFLRGDMEKAREIFGWSISPDKGVPTVGECIARLARVCHED